MATAGSTLPASTLPASTLAVSTLPASTLPASTLAVSEVNKDQRQSIKLIEIQELSRLQNEKDEVDGSIPVYDRNNNITRYEIRRPKIDSEQCDGKNKDRITTAQNQRQRTRNIFSCYARQTSRES
ncbi:Hypothetical predicted protein [Paramuricea clavata]|uniref:Uncharacterized protein n=2 Tax=Paramuricea clavata TaxID=317549 RepID=A0A7D9LAP6_PARCT|nr:Hypothetical predicted protein [Paramuricea clavata]